MLLSTIDILYIVLSIFTSIVGTLLIVALYRLIKILGVVNELMTYVQKVNNMLSMWEQIPNIILEKIKSIIGK
ncbi:MAG: hypothetical protein PHR68_01330 [Candidatus Gracilibacteria bacterium]|nr:hypothetical protein [Candidatus Gracilibacteria bacterium]